MNQIIKFVFSLFVASLLLSYGSPGFPTQIPKDFIRRQGNQLVVGNNDYPIQLNGVCFGNQVWPDDKGNNPPISSTHHNEDDYGRVHDMHMNVVRFYLNYSFFEDNKPYQFAQDDQAALAWLDQNIKWAKKHGIYLILNMHVPPGGYQSNGNGLALWDDQNNRERLINLWRTIAEKYKDEPVIGGYDLLNEPVVSSSISQWEDLAKQIVTSIRSVDQNHLIIVERMNAIYGKGKTYNDLNFFLIDDSNLIYTFHFYAPSEYSHQNTPWTNFPEDGVYPDLGVNGYPSDLEWRTTICKTHTVPAGDTGWQLYTGELYNASNSELIVGYPAFRSETNEGTVYFDNFVIKEYDENKKYLRDIYDVNITSSDCAHSFWSADNKGSCSLSTSEGYGDRASIQITGTTANTNYSLNKYRFPVTAGHYYQINGYMKGVAVSHGAICQMQIDFMSSPSGRKVHPRNKEYLNSELTRYLDWGVTNNVPMYVGEFGLYKDCFANNKGGIAWVSDMIDLLSLHGVHFTYHAYHESNFGIYMNDSGLPDPSMANVELINLFTEKLPFNTIKISRIGAGHGGIKSEPTGIDCGTSCSADYSPGTSVKLTATADTGSTFSGWSGACTETDSCWVTMDAKKSVTATFNRIGDVNLSGDVDITDAILAIQVLSTIIPAGTIYKEPDVNGDGKIGLEEVIFILQKAAGLR